MDFSFISNAHPSYIENLYKTYQSNPLDVPEGWREFFAGYEYAGGSDSLNNKKNSVDNDHSELSVFALIDAYRKRGHLNAKTNPIRKRKFRFPSLDLGYFGLNDSHLEQRFMAGKELGLENATLSEIIDRLDTIYCGSIGFEYAHIENQDKYLWLKDKIEVLTKKGEYGFDIQKKKRILEKLNGATGFENFLGKKYIAQKRFGLEGGESTIHALDGIINRSAEIEVEEIVIGMAHRGRLNVLANIMGKTYEYIFSEFEGNAPEDIFGDGDVKYHLGFSSQVQTPSGQTVNLKLVPNPSHLEAVNPVVEGFTRAKADVLYRSDFDRIMPILIHGDAAIAGQGVIHEVVQMSQLEGYYTGGTIHFVINNQIGFTTDFEDGRSSTYCTGVAGLVQAPVFHVNGDDAEAVLFVAELAAEYRQEFNNDVFIDMVCYRKHGHNEGDDPKFTQPQFYDLIKKQKTTRKLYSEKLITTGQIEADMARQMDKEFEEQLQMKFSQIKEEPLAYEYQKPELDWKKLKKFTTVEDYIQSPNTGVPLKTLKTLLNKLQTFPENFTPLPKFNRILGRTQNLIDKGLVEWSMAEHLAYATLLVEGHDVRITGQDVKRGTFSHRNAVLYDAKTNQQYNRFSKLKKGQGQFRIHNSLLSEFAVLGFEFGYTLASPDPLVIWEAQFGDFANGAQTIFDQFISSSESKWQRMTGLVMLLPHGYEGQGPEHSSARLERYLQSCAENNLTVANVTTPANFFHLLRRQQARPFRKPLVVMTPKKLLRAKNLDRSNDEIIYRECVSSIEALSKGGFRETYDDPMIKTKKEAAQIRRVLCCSGKIYYDLLDHKEANKRTDVAIVRLEQIYPFPKAQVDEIIEKYSNAEWFWVQEEPENMGAWSFILSHYRKYDLQLVSRKASASPATGFKIVHESQQQDIIHRAFAPAEPKKRNTGRRRKNDLSKLKGMSVSLMKKLEAEGINTFEQLAEMDDNEIAALNKRIPEFGQKFERFDWKIQSDVLK